MLRNGPKYGCDIRPEIVVAPDIPVSIRSTEVASGFAALYADHPVAARPLTNPTPCAIGAQGAVTPKAVQPAATKELVVDIAFNARVVQSVWRQSTCL